MVQAPHCAMPQPNLVPVSPSVSRRTQSNGVSGSTSTSCVCPLIVRRGIILLLNRLAAPSRENSSADPKPSAARPPMPLSGSLGNTSVTCQFPRGKAGTQLRMDTGLSRCDDIAHEGPARLAHFDL